eukprot:365531-Chlamydomonas_euryale.AAC.7
MPHLRHVEVHGHEAAVLGTVADRVRAQQRLLGATLDTGPARRLLDLLHLHMRNAPAVAPANLGDAGEGHVLQSLFEWALRFEQQRWERHDDSPITGVRRRMNVLAMH